MTDARRTRWHSWDADFLGGKLGVGIRQRFGITGVGVFLAFISACKRSSIPGRITYHTDADALSVLSLPGLRLVNEQGEEWTLDTFWTYLGQQKMTSRRRRGDLTEVISTRWQRWQEDFGKQVDATRKTAKRRSGHRAETPDSPLGDVVDTAQRPLGDLSDTDASQCEDSSDTRQRAGQMVYLPGRKPDDTPTDKDTYNDSDKDKNKHSAANGGESVSSPFEAFWSAYPRRVDKGHARAAWATATKKADPEAIVAGAVRYAADPNLPDMKFRPHPATWLRGERWNDGAEPSVTGRANGNGNGHHGQEAAKLRLLADMKAAP